MSTIFLQRFDGRGFSSNFGRSFSAFLWVNIFSLSFIFWHFPAKTSCLAPFFNKFVGGGVSSDFW